jgi:threonylcarbamoyladenosine tRNA methylthiotransferase MtaB
MTRSRVSILTHGCRANQYEGDVMRRCLEVAPSVSEAGGPVLILNGCTVTELAEHKARQAARRFRRAAAGGTVILIGCIADAVRQGLTRFPEADVIAGGAWKARIRDVLSAALDGRRGILPDPPVSSIESERSGGPQARIRAFLKVQDGCSLRCTYCRPTQVRGPCRSKSVEGATEEAHGLINSGFPEIVLTGINLAQYAPADGRLPDLMKRILAVPGLRRLRLASINASGLTDALLDVFAEDDRGCRHFHVPLQSGDGDVLASMRRGYTVAEYEGRLDRVRGRLPNATFGTDLMVGFPGEDEAAFLATCSAVRRARFSNTHIFRYSPRRGTEAIDLTPRVSEAVKRRRAGRLARLCRRIRGELLDKRIGTTQDVLVEACRNGRWCGYTRDYLYVSFDSDSDSLVGQERAVDITGTAEDHLRGEDADRDCTR